MRLKDEAGKTYGEYGHIGIVTGYNPSTWMIQITDSNSQGNGEKKTYEILASEVTNSDWGFVHLTNPNQPQVTTEEIDSKYSQEAVNYAKNVRSDPDFKLVNVPEEFRTETSNYLAENQKVYSDDDPVVQSLLQKAELAEWLWASESLAKTVSGKVQRNIFETFTWSKAQFLRKIQFLLDEEPLNKLIEVKERGATFGALSNAELGLLTKSASFLNSAANRDPETNIITGFTMDEDEFIENIKVLEDKYLQAIWKLTWDTTQEIDLEEELMQWVWSTLPSWNDIWIYFE